MRQYASFLWFERAESRFMRGTRVRLRACRRQGRRLAGEDRAAGRGLSGEGAQRPSQRPVDPRRSTDHFADHRREHPPGRSKAGWPPSRGTSRRCKTFAERAYRRPLSSAGARATSPRFIARCATADGLSHEDAMRDTMVSVLMSPHFCYRVDLPGDGRTGIRPLSDYALASRLSYFLWSSMPDDELLAHAAAGELHRPEVLVAEARRMLHDDRIRGLATEFGGNWLDFRRFEEHNSVDRGRFPVVQRRAAAGDVRRADPFLDRHGPE